MGTKINLLWNRVSRIGLHENEGVIKFRDVIFMNRLLSITPVIFLLYIPFEIYFNGVKLLPLVLIFMGLLMFPLYMNSRRYFTFSRYYSFFIGIFFIFFAGLSVGPSVGNYVALIPASLLGIILFKSNAEKIISLLFVAASYLLQQYLFTVVEPAFIIPAEVHQEFSSLFFIMALVLNFLLGFYFVGITGEFESIIVQQKDAIEFKKKEITDSISYAKRIQNAILPPEKVVRKLLPESFILYKPKDIVAGDFYWLEKSGDLILFAAADCTGHGVPGAMVSVVCHNALNRSVREFSLTTPSEILNKTREIIIHEFSKSEEDIKDGMDISLCALDSVTGEIQWTGANNPLMIISNGEIVELKPDKQPVGQFSAGKSFTNHIQSLSEGDLLYLYSDGYADQFGGPSGKKFKHKQFKQLLLEIHKKPLSEQKSILDQRFESWRGSIEQLDDLCVIGIKYNKQNA